MRKLFVLLGLVGVAAAVAVPATATGGDTKPRCGKVDRNGYEVIFDGSRKCFELWRYAGGSQVTLQRDGTLRTEPGPPNLGVLWYAARPYGDFSLKLQFRDDSPIAGERANSGVQVRFPAPRPPVPGCPMTFNGNPQTVNPEGCDRGQLRARGPDQRLARRDRRSTRARRARSTASRT